VTPVYRCHKPVVDGARLRRRDLGASAGLVEEMDLLDDAHLRLTLGDEADVVLKGDINAFSAGGGAAGPRRIEDPAVIPPYVSY
jgi:hypothetical protein